MPEPVSVMIARFPGGNMEHSDTTDWLIPTVLTIKSDSRIKDVLNWKIADTPICMGRNHAIILAQEKKVDFLCMIDSDMKPDAYHVRNTSRIALDPQAKLFWDSSFDFIYEQRFKHDAPCMVAVPYCGPPPHENIYVFHWENKESGVPIDQDMSLEQYSRRHASEMHGIVECGALPTGLILIDMLTLKDAPQPLTYYEWTDKSEIRKASTEDVTFTRDTCLRGYRMFCNWDAWAGHWKPKCVGKPVPMESQQIGQHLREAVYHELGADVNKGETFQMVGSKNGDQLKLPFVASSDAEVRVVEKSIMSSALEAHAAENRELPYSGAVEEKPDLSGLKKAPTNRVIGIIGIKS